LAGVHVDPFKLSISGLKASELVEAVPSHGTNSTPHRHLRERTEAETGIKTMKVCTNQGCGSEKR
jgi:hypothetical protein